MCFSGITGDDRNSLCQQRYHFKSAIIYFHNCVKRLWMDCDAVLCGQKQSHPHWQDVNKAWSVLLFENTHRFFCPWRWYTEVALFCCVSWTFTDMTVSSFKINRGHDPNIVSFKCTYLRVEKKVERTKKKRITYSLLEMYVKKCNRALCG